MTDAATARLALGDAICWDEGDRPAAQEGISPYVILCGGGSFEQLPSRDGYFGFPEWAGLRGTWGISHAAGRWQFEPSTWRGQAEKLLLGNFRDPAQQDAAGLDLAITVYHTHAGRVLIDDLLADRLGTVGALLHSTWTSVSESTFPQRYRESLERRENAAGGAQGVKGTTPPVTPVAQPAPPAQTAAETAPSAPREYRQSTETAPAAEDDSEAEAEALNRDELRNV